MRWEFIPQTPRPGRWSLGSKFRSLSLTPIARSAFTRQGSINGSVPSLPDKTTRPRAHKALPGAPRGSGLSIRAGAIAPRRQQARGQLRADRSTRRAPGSLALGLQKGLRGRGVPGDRRLGSAIPGRGGGSASDLFRSHAARLIWILIPHFFGRHVFRDESRRVPRGDGRRRARLSEGRGREEPAPPPSTRAGEPLGFCL